MQDKLLQEELDDKIREYKSKEKKLILKIEMYNSLHSITKEDIENTMKKVEFQKCFELGYIKAYGIIKMIKQMVSKLE